MNGIVKSFAYFNKIIKIIFNTIRMVQFHRISIPTNRCRSSFHSRHIFRSGRKGIESRSDLIVMLNLSCSVSPMFLSCFIPLGIMATTIMYQYAKITNKVSMRVFNFKVKDFNRLVEFDQVDAMNTNNLPILGIYKIVWLQISSIDPTSTLYLERVSFSTTKRFVTDLKFNQTINLVNRSGDNLLLCRFTGNVINTRNRIANLNGLDGFLTKRSQYGSSCNKGFMAPPIPPMTIPESKPSCAP